MGSSSQRNMDITLSTHVGDTKEIYAVADALDEIAKAAGNHVIPEAANLSQQLRELAKQQKLAVTFDSLLKETVDLGDGLAGAQKKVTDFNESINTMGYATPEMRKGLADAKKEVDALTKQLTKKQTALEKARTAMTETGVDATRLSAEEARLADSIKRVSTQVSQMASMGEIRKALDIPSHEAVNAEIIKLRDQYAKLRDEGKLSWKENAQAAIALNDKIREIENSTGDWMSSLGNAKTEIAKSVAAMGGMAVAARAAMDFESAMADVAKVANGTDGQIAHLGDELKQLSTELPVSAGGLAEIAKFGAQLGVPIEKLKEFTATTAKLSVAFDMTAQEAGQAMATLSTSFNIPIENISELGDAINTISTKAGVAEKNIIEVANRTAGTAKQFGLTAEQVTVLGAAFLKTGRTPEIAASAINRMLNMLQTLVLRT